MKSELFIIRDEKGPVLYAPLKKKAARLNESAVIALAHRLNGGQLSAEDEEAISPLIAHGFLEDDKLPEKDDKSGYLTLFPTDGCNLRCRYCYAASEKIRHIMPLEMGMAAVDHTVLKAKEKGIEDIIVAFHGNGEPFYAFPFVKKICEYTSEKGEKEGFRTSFTAATNGCFSEEILDYVIAWFDAINISFDGTKYLQDLQRPLAGGGSSFRYVDRTLRRLNDSGTAFGIRTTLTAQTVDHLTEVAQFVLENYPKCEVLHIEPVWEIGRCMQNDEHTPESERFIGEFLKAEEMLHGKMNLVFSSARSGYLSRSFCGVPFGSFVVTAEGNVTSCYEVCEHSDTRSSRFIYGKYDPENKSFIIDKSKVRALEELTVNNFTYCKDCFCKYHCAGDCPAKLLGLKKPAEHAGSERCRITRALTMRQISRMLEEG